VSKNAKNKSASEAELKELHRTLAATLNKLSAIEVITEVETDADGVEKKVQRTYRPHPSVLSVAAKFLKDNNISMDIENDDNLAELRDKLNKRRPSPGDLDAARVLQ
jgi:hypothetical protein